jgi:glycosyltransferase involved in cell wall biosynthesis
MKKIRVAFCLRDMQLGGVESVLIRTLDKLQAYKNIDISIITYVNITEPIYREYFKTHPDIKCFSLYPCKKLGTKLPHFVVSRIILHILRDVYRFGRRTIFGMRKFKDFDVFIDYHDFGFYDEFKYIKHARKIAWFHSSVNVFVKRAFINQVNGYDKIVVLTDEFINDLNSKYPNQNNKFIRIYNPIDIENIKVLANQGKLNIDGDYFCTVSRLTTDKDVKTLLDAFDMFWNENGKPNVKLVVVGDGNKKSEYEHYAQHLHSSKNILFVGAQKNPFVYMKHAIANVLSSRGEGLPTVLIESAAVGTLNISSACKCGPREILLDGRGGLLFMPGNANQLAKLFTDVYNKNIDIKPMIKNSSDALNRFDADKIIKQIISLIS